MKIRLFVLLLIALLGVDHSGANSRFLSVDRRAIGAPRNVETSISSLVAYLCPSHFSELQKSRAIFRWIADRIRYDIEGLREEKLASQKAEDVLQERKAVCAGYSRLFQTMAQEAGLEAVYVVGHSPFNDHLPVSPEGEVLHAWNAVKVDGKWRLLDVTWAAGHSREDKSFVMEFNDFWFDTRPEQFIYSHLPKEERWQLLATPWTVQRFREAPQLKPEFFALGLKLKDQQTQPLQVKEEAIVRWSAPPGVAAYSRLVDEKGQMLEGWTLTQSPPNGVETRIRTPGPGRYTLKIFGAKRKSVKDIFTEGDWSHSLLASYKVVGLPGVGKQSPRTTVVFAHLGCELLSPRVGRLASRRRHTMRLRLKGDQEIAAFLGESLVAPMRRHGGVLEVSVDVPAQSAPLSLRLRDPNSPLYVKLLEYAVD